MIVWRIGTETPDYPADDLNGNGAKLTGGRWNKKGLAVVYCSQTIALAVLETIVHFGQWGLPLNRYLVEIRIPDDVWQSRAQGSPPAGWDAVPEGMGSIIYGSDWLVSGASAVLEVPSVIVPEERNVLLNPRHADCSRVTGTTVRRWGYDHRLRAQK